MSTRRFLLAAAFAAMAFTFFACSSDEPDGDGSSSSSGATQGGGIDLSNLPPQELVFDGELEGKIDVFLRIWHDDGEYGSEYDRYDLLPAGKIENRKLSLSLPTNINSKYLDILWGCYYDERNCSLPPSNIAYAYGTLVVPTLGDCRIRSYLIKSGKAMDGGSAMPFYNSASGKVTGTREEEILDLNLSQGWQLIYFYRSDDICFEDEYGSHRCEYWTTDLPTGATLGLRLQCD